MKTATTRNSLLATLALAGLLAYVLACASFSPDDSKVATPAFDPQTGDLGAAVYDRKSGRVEQVFSFSAVNSRPDSDYDAAITRVQWVDNHRLLVSWIDPDKDEILNLAVLPHGAAGAVRQWQITDLKDLDDRMVNPLALSGNRLFVVVDSNLVARFDLQTGRIQHHQCPREGILLYPAESDERVFYCTAVEGQRDQTEFGYLDAATFKLTTLFRTDATNANLDGPLAFSPDGRRLVTAQAGEKARLSLLQGGKAPQTILLPAEDGEELEVGGICFAPRQDTVHVSYLSKRAGQTNVSLGVFTVPLDNKPIVRTPIVPALGKVDGKAARYFQPASSHDGKMLALTTTYFFGEKEAMHLYAKECALFLVDLTKKPHQVKRVPLAVPKADKQSK